jgi:pantoate--beta-alanine ligase
VSDRRDALVLSAALRAGASNGAEGAGAVLAAARSVIGAEGSVSVDYVELVDATTFDSVAADHQGDALLVVAARVGPTRLIDNTTVAVGGSGAHLITVPATEEV